MTESLSFLRKSQPCSPLLSLLLSSATIERALGDVYICASGGQKCPSLFKDLVSSNTLAKVLGPVSVYLLACLMGPPTTLNLRNIYWHGFFSPEEISSEYAMLLLTVIISIGALLEENEAVSSNLVHRLPVVFTEEQLRILRESNTPLSKVDLSEDLLLTSTFIAKTKLPIWREACFQWKNNRYGLFLALLLPELEHGLRMVFARVNDVPKRACTAESSTLFTTFDEILSPELEDNTLNKLPTELGSSIMEMLQDLLVHSSGLRLRDRISHGEVDLNLCPLEVALFVMSVAVRLCVRCDGSKAPLERYKSLYHPASLLKEALLSALVVLSMWDGIPAPPALQHINSDAAAVPYKQCCASIAAAVGFRSSPGRFTTEGKPFVRELWNQQVVTLFVPRHHLEVIKILRQILASCHTAASQIETVANERYRQFVAKELRSRQRNNYERLLERLQAYMYAILMCALYVVFLMSKLKDCSVQDVERNLRVLKRLLSSCENTVSQTAKCRWEETEFLCASKIDLVKQLLNLN